MGACAGKPATASCEHDLPGKGLSIRTGPVTRGTDTVTSKQPPQQEKQQRKAARHSKPEDAAVKKARHRHAPRSKSSHDPSKQGSAPVKPYISFPQLHIEQLYDATLLLGSGGGGETYMCYDLHRHQNVAIKFMRRPLPKSVVQLVMREIQIQADLGQAHISIIGVRSLVITQSHLGIVMDYAAGGNMTSYVADRWESALSRNGLHFTEDEARYYFAQFVSAVEFIHRHGVAHRDLKLDNTLLDTTHSPPRLKICDFGFAKMWDPETANLFTAIGTPVYMSPQLITAKNRPGSHYNGAKADVWSSGVLLFVMLLGMFPFEHTSHPDPNSPDAHNEVWLNQIKKSWRDVPRVSEALARGALTEECQQLLDALFEFDENKRITMAEVKQHPWLTKPMRPEHQEAWEAMQEEQWALDERLEANPPETSERDKALMSMIALATHTGKPGEQPWTLPLVDPSAPSSPTIPMVAGTDGSQSFPGATTYGKPEMRVMGGALSKELDERCKREISMKAHPMRRFSLV